MSHTADGPEGEGSTPNKRLKTRYGIWEHFIEIDNGTRTNCKYCNQNFSLKHGTTTHLQRHLSSCDKVPMRGIPHPLDIDQNKKIAALNQPSMTREIEVAWEIEVKKAILGNLVFAPPKIRKAWSSLMVMDIEKEIHTYYQKEKENLIAQLGNLTSRVCFSIGIMIETGWVSITAHFINDDYNLVKSLIGFKKLHVSELKNAVTNVIESCISDWKLKDKIFTFTIGEDLESFDNVLRIRFDKKMLLRAHEMFISCSREELARIYFYYLKSECSVEKDQIINLLRDVLENGSKYGRLNEIARKMGLPPINKDWLKGQPAGWCAGTQVWKFCCFVVKMFKEALLYKDVFCQHALAVPRRIDNPFMLKIDPHCINWSKVEDAVKCFERIDPVICILPSFKFPTSNLYIQNLTNLNEILTRFGGFYSCRPNCCIGCVLDPRYKLIFLEYVFHRDEFVVISQGTTFGEVINIFHSLFRIYANEEKTNQVIPLPIGTANPQNEGPSINSTNTCPSIIIDDFNLYVKQSKHAKREMYEYLMEATADIEETNFDLLGWWKENGLRYPVLCRMARDVLAMPDCIYDYEKGLNIDLSILEGVSPELAEAVICSKDWILSDV